MRLMNKIDSSFFLGIWGKTKKNRSQQKCILHRTRFTAKTYPHTPRTHAHARTYTLLSQSRGVA
uniref:Uncharacterized protein n=1 Tax=Anguilla anguilla TaxID=7936 RepID=A0A0E9TMI1_ANGAN